MLNYLLIRMRWGLLLFLLIGPTHGFSQSIREKEERLVVQSGDNKPVRLNAKNFQKNLEKYASSLDLRARQIKKLNRIERKFGRKEAKLARRSTTKKKHLRALQKEKRERMIAVLDYDQQQKLAKLSKTNGLKSFFNQLLGTRE